ncbi:hypothetical protein [Paenibacillus wynnii]|uniref:hypothetical protein n=1 Tax=Paenibacillus wynnii TaxID=268407 RepID=UPI00278FE324|nr:hypothetical protein [Paenibacillus wynnii]MDQ0194182.1 hypothetical protein [Paenibacillus wynnii]
MAGKIVYMFLIYAAVLAYDLPAWRRASKKGRLVYSLLLAFSAYLCIIYAADLVWPNVDQLFHLLFAEPSKLFIKSLKGL